MFINYLSVLAIAGRGKRHEMAAGSAASGNTSGFVGVRTDLSVSVEVCSPLLWHFDIAFYSYT